MGHDYLDLLHGREKEDTEREEDGGGGKQEAKGAHVDGSMGSEEMKRSLSGLVWMQFFFWI